MVLGEKGIGLQGQTADHATDATGDVNLRFGILRVHLVLLRFDLFSDDAGVDRRLATENRQLNVRVSAQETVQGRLDGRPGESDNAVDQRAGGRTNEEGEHSEEGCHWQLHR